MEEKEIDISGLDKAKVLLALYEKSQVQGMGLLTETVGGLAVLKDAQAQLSLSTYVDYFKGRVIKVELSKDSFRPWLFDRDNGQGAAQRAIDTLK